MYIFSIPKILNIKGVLNIKGKGGFPGGSVVKNPPANAEEGESESEVAQSCPTLCDPVDCSLPGSSVHGICQARILEWVAISFSRGSSQLRDWTWVFCIAGGCFTLWATREASAGGMGSVLSQEDALEKEMAAYSSILAWEIPWAKEPGGL